jgi:hypothetical protein
MKLLKLLANLDHPDPAIADETRTAVMKHVSDLLALSLDPIKRTLKRWWIEHRLRGLYRDSDLIARELKCKYRAQKHCHHLIVILESKRRELK